MPEAMNQYMETQPQVRNLFRNYINSSEKIEHTYISPLRQKQIKNTGIEANLVLRTSGYIGTNSRSKREEGERVKFKQQMFEEGLVANDFEYYRSPVYKPMSRDVEGPYTVREMDPARIQKIIYDGKEIFFGITNQNHLVMYSVVEQKGKRQMVVHAVERVYNHQNTTAYLKNKARKTLLELIKRNNNILPFRTSIVQVREAA